MNEIIHTLGAATTISFAILVAANATVIVAKLLHQDNFANRLISVASRVTWPLKIGGRVGPQ